MPEHETMTAEEQSEIERAVAEISEQMHETLTWLCLLEDRLKEIRRGAGSARRPPGRAELPPLRIAGDEGSGPGP